MKSLCTQVHDDQCGQTTFLTVLSFYSFVFLNWIYLRAKGALGPSSFALSVAKPSLVGTREIPALCLVSALEELLSWKSILAQLLLELDSTVPTK